MNGYQMGTMTLRRKPIRFHNGDLAKIWADRWPEARRVVLGDDGKWWVVVPADAATLEKNGYEVMR